MLKTQKSSLVRIFIWIFILKLGITKARQPELVTTTNQNKNEHVDNIVPKDIVPLLAQQYLGQNILDQFNLQPYRAGRQSPVDTLVRFDHRAWHVQPIQAKQELGYPSVSHINKRNNIIESKRNHDIFNFYAAPHKVAFGHFEQRPTGFEQRFESLNNGNRYKGKIKWGDESGAYGENYWNLVQGKL